MVQRRMPERAGPRLGRVASGGGDPGPRPSGQRGGARRVPRLDPPARTSRTRIGEGGLRRSAGPARRTKAPRPPRRISGRAAALALLVLGLILAYAYPVRIYLAQQSQIHQLQAEQDQQRQRIQDLNERVARWADDTYVEAQAASRLHLVKPGQLLYVIGTDATATTDAAVHEGHHLVRPAVGRRAWRRHPPQGR